MKTKKIITLIIIATIGINYQLAKAQWIDITPGTSDWLRDIYCPAPNTCYVVGDNGTVFKTTDSGSNWQLKNTGIQIAQTYSAVFCISPDTCWIGHGNGGIYKTTDGGDVWTQQSNPLSAVSSLFFVNDTLGFAVGGGGGDLIKTEDGGNNWQWVNTGVSGIIYDVFFPSIDTGYFVCVSPGVKIYNTVDGGNIWNEVFYRANGQAVVKTRAMFFNNNSTGFVVLQGGEIFKTYDGGQNWDTLTSGVTSDLISIFCVDLDTCYAVGAMGTILKTIDGGNTWNLDTADAPVTASYTGVFFPTGGIVYVTAQFIPLVLKKGTWVGVNELFASKPQIFIYPNPFKEKAIINYLPNQYYTQPLKFELYNMLGKKLSENYISVGHSTLERKNLASGIYFYNILAGNRTVLSGKLIAN